jgi:hypothetical protein
VTRWDVLAAAVVLSGLLCLVWLVVARRRKRAAVEAAVIAAWEEAQARRGERRPRSVGVPTGRARVPEQRQR